MIEEARKAADYARAAYGWKSVLARTAGYCTVSVAARVLSRSEAPSQQLMHRYLRGALRQLGIELETHGTEKIRPATPCIIAVNHNSYLDIPCVGALLDFDYKWVSKKEVFYWPFVGWHLWACGHIWVDRKRKDNSERLAREFHRVLGNGASILMFPEGTRSPDGHLQSFKRGAFVTAVTEEVPVLPIALDGTERLMEKGSLDFPRGEERAVRIKVMDPVLPPARREGGYDQRVTWMRDRTREAMVAALDDLRGAPGAAERPTL